MVICLLNKKKTTKKNFRYISSKSWLLRKRGRRQGREKLTVSKKGGKTPRGNGF